MVPHHCTDKRSLTAGAREREVEREIEGGREREGEGERERGEERENLTVVRS